jgi:hypothetical protein
MSKLHEVGPQFEDVSETRVPGTGVIHRDSPVTDVVRRPTDGAIVLYLHVPGDLDDELSRRAGDHVSSVSVDHGRGREVTTEPDVCRQLPDCVEGALREV